MGDCQHYLRLTQAPEGGLRRFRVPSYPIVPAVFIASASFILVFLMKDHPSASLTEAQSPSAAFGMDCCTADTSEEMVLLLVKARRGRVLKLVEVASAED